MRERLMVICLDAFDAQLSDELIAAGRLPGLARLKAESARYKLEHGHQNKARYTGLTWEHFSSGRKPETSGKWSVISFDPSTFQVHQSHATERPFIADVEAKCVLFDVPYFDLQSAPNVTGVVGWGGHDLGVRAQANPRGLMAEINAKFGAPPDIDALNVMVYPSVDLTRRMGKHLRASVKQRTDIAEWLFTERVPDWDIAMLAYGEPHDAIELLYHGVDPNHHLADMPSAPVAREGVIAVYEEISAQIERLMDRFPDVTMLAFTMHGMGENDTDVPTMLLLPELMYRMNFERPLFTPREDWRSRPAPVLKEGEDWNDVVIAQMAHPQAAPRTGLSQRLMRDAKRFSVRMAKEMLGESFMRELSSRRGPREKTFNVDWMPAAQYMRYWSQMDAFAVPSFFEGRVRINLEGREKNGRVPLECYGEMLDHIEETLRACVDTKTGEPVVREIVRSGRNDPMTLDNTQGDIAVLWNRSPVGFRHPTLGEIGPAPVRRAGGHSGGLGALFIRSKGIKPGERGLRSSFDVAPTIVDLLGLPCHAYIDGESVLGHKPINAENVLGIRQPGIAITRPAASQPRPQDDLPDLAAAARVMTLPLDTGVSMLAPEMVAAEIVASMPAPGAIAADPDLAIPAPAAANVPEPSPSLANKVADMILPSGVMARPTRQN